MSAKSHKPTKAQLFALVEDIALMIKDGERDDDGEPTDMQNDDAYETLHNIISSARELLGMKPDQS